jgi:hypothetical protein
MNKLIIAAVVAIFSLLSIAPIAIAQDTNETPSFEISGDRLPTTVTVATDATYTNTIGLFTAPFVAEPGVLTADSVEGCIINGVVNTSCWHINPSNQVKLTDLEAEGLDLREGGWLMVTGAYVTLTVDGVTLTVNAIEDHSWFVIIRGLLPDGDGSDRNRQVIATSYNAGFTLATNLPVGSRVSEEYFEANVFTAHNVGNCGDGGCTAVSALFYDLNTGAWTVITQDTSSSAWELVATNVATQ